MLKLEDIKKDAQVSGIQTNEIVRIVTVEPVGDNAITVYFKDSQGRLGEQMLFRSDEPRLELAQAGKPWAFDAPGADFKLALEAWRIQLAYLFDPMMAVHTSNVDPLHGYRDWLKKHLSRFDLRCVDSTETLDQTPFSMTIQGLMHLDKGRFEKKDQQRVDDPRQWCLGFSNKNRLAALKADHAALDMAVHDLGKATQAARSVMDNLEGTAQTWGRIAKTSWALIDVQSAQARMDVLRSDLDALERPDSDLGMAKVRWEAASAEHSGISKSDFHLEQAALLGFDEATVDLAEKTGDPALLSRVFALSSFNDPMRIADLAAECGQPAMSKHWCIQAAKQGDLQAMRHLIDHIDSENIFQGWVWVFLSEIRGEKCCMSMQYSRFSSSIWLKVRTRRTWPWLLMPWMYCSINQSMSSAWFRQTAISPH